MRRGPEFKKARERKERRKVEGTGRSFIHIWTTGALHMFRGLNVECLFFVKPKCKKGSPTQKHRKVGKRQRTNY